MPLFKLIPPTDSRLRQISEPVPLPGMFMEGVGPGLFETMYFHNGQGLAGTQIGRPQRIAVVDTGDEKLTLINPRIIEASEEMVENEEGCLSCPNILVTVPRHKTITIKNYDLKGKETTHKLEGLTALVVQHEIDHFDGKLIIDHLSSIKKDVYKRANK